MALMPMEFDDAAAGGLTVTATSNANYDLWSWTVLHSGDLYIISMDVEVKSPSTSWVEIGSINKNSLTDTRTGLPSVYDTTKGVSVRVLNNKIYAAHGGVTGNCRGQISFIAR